MLDLIWANRTYWHLILLVSLWICQWERGIAQATDQGSGQPNVVFVLADDLGWTELGCYGNVFNETPNLDALARDGVRFTQAYAAAPVCSPYRAALLTGQHPARVGIIDYLRPNSANALSTELDTLPKILQRHGYRTGMIGKWHLTGYRNHGAEYEVRPTDHGFDWNFGSEVKGVGNGANFWPYVFRTQPIRWIDIKAPRLGENEYLTDRLNLEAVDFIERNCDQPFFLFLSHYAPHTILNGRPDLVDKYRQKHAPGPSMRQRCYLCEDAGKTGDELNHWAGDHNPHLAAMLESIDNGIGMIREKLVSLDIADNTIVIFSSDNGGETNVTSNAPLRGGKSELYEGGIRVPLIVSWPERMPKSALAEAPTVNTDFLPTILDAADIAISGDHALDGISMLKTWQHPQVTPEDRTLYWHYPLDQPHFLGGHSAGAIRDGDWKLIEPFDGRPPELYQLNDDPSEHKDLANTHPQIAERLRERLHQWRTQIDARIPSPPLLTRPRQLYFADHFSCGRASERWFFHKSWHVDDDVLKRSQDDEPTTRIFIKDVEFQDALIRFDFRMQESQDIRLVTGSDGHYNAVLHIRPDHFFLQTAKDPSGPYFSYRHGECAFDFEPGRWYSMTVEFVEDHLVAHLDHDHVVYAKHPILNKQRTYFAFQVDSHAAAFDNVQIFHVSKHSDFEQNLQLIHSLANAHRVKKSIEEQYAILKSNSHAWRMLHDPDYVALVERIDQLDAENAQRYPDVFQTHKSFRKSIAEKKQRLREHDPRYKALLTATHKAQRAIDQFLLDQDPHVAKLPPSRQKHALEQLHRRFKDDDRYRNLVSEARIAQQALQEAYPDLFISDDEIHQAKLRARHEAEKDPVFRERMQTRAAAWRAQQEYLLTHDQQLASLHDKVEAARKAAR